MSVSRYANVTDLAPGVAVRPRSDLIEVQRDLRAPAAASISAAAIDISLRSAISFSPQAQ